MQGYKRILVWSWAVVAACGCAGAPPQIAQKPATAERGDDVLAYDVPAAISAGERGTWEARLFLLADGAEKRLALRDRLAESIAASFEATPESKPAKRLELFKEGLTLNAPADFRSGDVAQALAPAAQWVVARYERRGDEVVVLASLKYLALVDPKDLRYHERFLSLAEWSEGVRRTVSDPLESASSIADLYMRVARLVPDDEICERTANQLVAWNAAYAARIEAAGSEMWSLSPFALREAEKIPIFVAYLFFINGDVTRARPWFGRLKSDFRAMNAFESLLDGISRGEDVGDAYFALAQLFGSYDADSGQFSVGDPQAGLRACILARRLGEKNPRYPLCIGQFFELIDRPENAVPFYVETARMSPDESTYMGVAARIRFALSRVHMLERSREAAGVIEIADGFVEDILKLKDVEDKSLYQVTAELLRLSGEVEYADGRIEKAAAHFTKASEVWPGDVGAVFRLAEIREMRGEADAALELLDAAIERARGAGGADAAYWPGRAHQLRGEIREGKGDEAGAAEDYRAALAVWEKGDLPLDYAAEGALRRGLALDRLGDTAGSLEWIRRSIGLDPENRATYGAAFSFLFERQRLEAAEELFQIAFNQDRIGSMWKIYFALWVDGLARRQGKTVELARNYLAHADGDTWQDDLARFASARIGADELRKRAQNDGQRVEADFYVGLSLLGEGKPELARPLFEKVIASDMMGFFEYPMARALLATQR
jgi:tetratricopeptide (TPR) repeat protein